MSNIRVDVGYTIKDGSELKFRSPVDCSAITGLIVYYPGANGAITSKVFSFADAHGNNVGDIDHLFAEDVVVKVILDVTKGMAFVQNADTNAYLEAQLASKAPAGYGLGCQESRHIDSADNITENGWYRTASGTPDGNWWLVFAHVSDGAYQVQTAYRVFDGAKRERAKLNNYWTEWVDCSPSAFAPSGYGLGEKYCRYVNTLDEITSNGFYSLWLDTANGDPTTGNSVFHAVVNGNYNNVHLSGKVGGGYLHRDKWDGVWQPWEWVNPPMTQEYEFRTTERLFNSPVYKKLFYYGILPVGQSSALHGITGLAQVKKVTLLPHGVQTYLDHNPSITQIDVDAERIYITNNNGALSERNCFVLIEYVKS